MKNNSVHQEQARPEPMPHLIDEGSGIDIQRREGGTNWPKRWRVRLIRNKNERDHQRVTAYGDTLPEAMSAVRVAFSLDGMAQGVAAPQSVASRLLNQERCHADVDGDCRHANCPQLRDGEPRATGRHCPLDVCDSVPGAAPQPPAQAENQALTYSSTQATKCAGCGEHKHTPLRIDAMGGYVCLSCIDKKLSSLLGEFGYPQAEAVQQPSRTRLKPLPVERDMFGRVLGVRVGPALFPVSVVREIEGALGIGTEIASDRRQIQTASHPMRRACDWPQIDGEG